MNRSPENGIQFDVVYLLSYHIWGPGTQYDAGCRSQIPCVQLLPVNWRTPVSCPTVHLVARIKQGSEFSARLQRTGRPAPRCWSVCLVLIGRKVPASKEMEPILWRTIHRDGNLRSSGTLQ